MTRGVVERDREVATSDRAKMLDHDHAITTDREETKYIVDQARAAAFLRVLSKQLVSHRFTGQGANLLPDAQHFSTTIYFDTARRSLFRAARDNPEHNAKLRAREYYDMHSSLAELATDPEQIVRYQPRLFFELKRREGARTFKHRVQLEKAKVADFFQKNAFEAAASGAVEHDDTDRAALSEFCVRLAEPLEPSCVVNYRRLAFEHPTAPLRVTVDLDVAFYAVPADLWQRTRALVRGSFGTPRGSAPGCLIEVKQRAELPVWLARALEETGARREAFSKFSAASEAVHGRG